jgi:hypothetical protein
MLHNVRHLFRLCFVKVITPTNAIARECDAVLVASVVSKKYVVEWNVVKKCYGMHFVLCLLCRPTESYVENLQTWL